MQRYTLYDKSGWQDGPWKDEPDYVAFVDAATSYPCVAVRNVLGAWLGRVGVDAQHPLYQMLPHAEEFQFVEVHDNPPNFASFLEHDSLQFNPPIHHWWIGFDTMQDADFCPWRDGNPTGEQTGTYRDLAYVVDQLIHLAYQLSQFDARIF